ncbi:hypothetical protein CUW_1436 [Turicibacter sanguinis PC909]|uniref:Uncharacterized protein n=1 Tax=Turicibacter sanguinis PC909 TaxID=702450 RepID=A0ABP2I1J2_9FIRM|nr:MULTISPECIES: hypothetical protein [Turicibacter]EFF63357.1 hypothetical protein CUW_1436 [Turicibacter sanguinis PC909]EGC91836.1 hypothetical protein HMPREF9402_2328 [Turicibacter sp. HGF1]
MKDIESKKKMVVQMAKLQYKFDKKILEKNGKQVKTQENLARIYKDLIEKELNN